MLPPQSLHTVGLPNSAPPWQQPRLLTALALAAAVVAVATGYTCYSSVSIASLEEERLTRLAARMAEAEAAAHATKSATVGSSTATLPLSEVEGLGLVEATYLVLVSGVTPPLAESGLQVKDTIMSVSVEGTELRESTRAMDLGATAERLTAAIKTAEENGVAGIGLELNRLVELKFSD